MEFHVSHVMVESYPRVRNKDHEYNSQQYQNETTDRNDIPFVKTTHRTATGVADSK
jgi:hypothetical protein